MQITSFNPIIIAKDSESVIALFEELGFERRHQKQGIDFRGITPTRMKDANGFCLDITHEDNPPAQTTGIRMNVRDFDEAYGILESHGFKNVAGRVVTTSSSKFAVMFSPSGFFITLVEHVRK